MRTPTLYLIAAAIAAAPLAAAAQDQDVAGDEAAAASEAYVEQAREGVDFPRDRFGLRRVERHAEIGEFGPIFEGPGGIGFPTTTFYLNTYMNSQTSGANNRSATVVSVTNQTDTTCRVRVTHFRGLTNDSAPVCTTDFSMPGRFTVDFCTRGLPGDLTTCNSTCSPALDFHEGRSLIASVCKDLGVSARVYYTQGEEDERLTAITDSKIVRYGEGNHGD